MTWIAVVLLSALVFCTPVFADSESLSHFIGLWACSDNYRDEHDPNRRELYLTIDEWESAIVILYVDMERPQANGLYLGEVVSENGLIEYVDEYGITSMISVVRELDADWPRIALYTYGLEADPMYFERR